MMRVTQGTFSYLPDLTDEQIEKQLAYALKNGWAFMVEYTDDPHPRNSLWEMYAAPNFDLTEDEAGVAMETVVAARKEIAGHYYIKVVCYDSSLGRQSSMLSFIVQRPAYEPGFKLERMVDGDRQIRYTIVSYATNAPQDERYRSNGSASNGQPS
jgi:ribulose-bisphosphate carboxylase small chain